MQRYTDLTFRQSIFLIIIVIMLVFFTNLHGYQTTPPGMAWDASYDLADGFRISQGFSLPLISDFRSEFAHRFLLGGWFALIGPSVFAAFLFQTLFNVFTVVFI